MIRKMLRFTLGFLFVAALVSGTAIPKTRSLRPNGRIVGGEKATIEDNPWQVSLQFFGIHNCGGSIIAPDTIITAAHCIDGLLSLFYEVVSGSADLLGNVKRSSIKQSIVHEGYDGLGNDVAVIILNEPLTFDDTTQAVPLADEEPAAGDVVKTSGWGITSDWDLLSPNLLYSVEVNVIDRQECSSDYQDVRDAEVDDTMVCAGTPEGGKDSCSGDSGGPLTKDGVLVGIVSWGMGCGDADYPGVYTNIASVREWIRENAGV